VTVILDGGLGTELEAQGHDISDRLWSARLLLSEPEAIEAVHLAYFRAGAQVATTGSYQATIPGFAAAGLDRATALAAMRTSVALALSARSTYAAEADRSTDGLLVAASVGPYGAMLADGSEYRGDYDPGAEALRDLHAPRIEALLEAGADLLAFETIPTAHEAEILLGLLDEFDAVGWLAMQCRDGGHTAAGEPIERVAELAASTSGLVAVGVNCTAPRHVPGILGRLRSVRRDLPLIAYPNGADAWDGDARHWVAVDDAGRYQPAVVAGWTALGADWLGGCCGTGPTEIVALTARLSTANGV
jgi:homocysteine S-methyltransferase